MKYGFTRVASCTPRLSLSNPVVNAETIAACVQEAHDSGVSIMVFPELSLTGYTCGDLFLQRKLQQSAVEALFSLVKATKDLPVLFAVGLPLVHNSKLYNCAAVVCMGRILGFVPKRNIPNFGEFYERRHFSQGPLTGRITLKGISYPFGSNQVFSCTSFPGLNVAVEICEDVFVPSPPSSSHACHGATVILNLSASDEIVTKAAYRRSLISIQSARLICAYAYSDAGFGESSTDMVFAGHNIIAENGKLLGESKLFTEGIVFRDVDIELLLQDRIRQSTFPDLIVTGNSDYTFTDFDLPADVANPIRDVQRHPFVPSDSNERSTRCEEIISIQSTGLARRLMHTGSLDVVIGVSGGLDSTLAFLVTVNAFRFLGLPYSGIHAISMPGFGTTSRTQENARKLSELFGADFREIPISDAVMLHFKDIGHDPDKIDVTYENSQARERTQILMDIANSCQGLVIGTGDLSELAIGWATYNGDHMSMYAVNCSVPKTLVKDLVAFYATTVDSGISAILLDVLATPPSPELLPHDNDKMTQVTEDLVGPYELHDFFLYYFVRYGFSPAKILFLAETAFDGKYDHETIKRWLKFFIKRFFTQQYKRSCLPDGPKVGSVCLSPRADWRMPSDALGAAWLSEAELL